MILLLLEVVFLLKFLLSFILLKTSRRSAARRLDLKFVVVVDFVIFVEENWGKKVGF